VIWSVMKAIARKQTEDLDLHALPVLDLLFRERTLTRAAEVLNTRQPALSKMLARLRTCVAAQSV
jgi:DNA-binding transcriptional LysR family regulator